MKVKIVKAKYPSLWYANKIGNIYEVGKTLFNNMYRLSDWSSSSCFIHKSDCRPITVARKTKTNKPMDKICTWENEGKYWHTSCGNDHIFKAGTPSENQHKYCPYCGRKLRHR